MFDPENGPSLSGDGILVLKICTCILRGNHPLRPGPSLSVTGGVGDLLREPGTACNHRETGIGSGPVPPGMGVVPAPVGFSRSGPKVTTSPKIEKGVSHSDLRQISLVVSLPALCL